MSESEVKNLYDSLVKSGDLKDVYPDLTGEWEKDNKKFTMEYERNQDLLFNDDLGDFYDEEDLLP